MAKILQTILQRTAETVKELKRSHNTKALEERIAGQDAPRSLSAALRSASPLGVIAEIKKASPSAGVIRPDFQPVSIARSYRNNGANALSVITDGPFFQGDIQFIADIRPSVDLPILRKDFIIDPIQILEARAYGADAILLIVAALAPAKLGELLRFTRSLGMEALIETHHEGEVAIALEQGAEIVGVNNRNLDNFVVDLAMTERLSREIPTEKVLVAESGIATPRDVQRMQATGAKGILVGTHFMRQPDPGKALQTLMQPVAEAAKV